MKKCYFTYDEWKCITRKRQKVQYIDTDLFSGFYRSVFGFDRLS